MRIIEVPTAPPFGTIPVNTARIYAVRPHAAAPTKAADLLIESAGARSILAEVAFDTVASLLGPEFVELEWRILLARPAGSIGPFGSASTRIRRYRTLHS